MSLKIIGPGFGRTGTKTVKLALEHLGFGPCHHMYEVFANPEQVSHWTRFAAGEQVDVRTMFEGYQSQIDWPGAHVWRELHAAFPEAKVLLTMRPEEDWWASFSKTIGKFFRVYGQLDVPPHITEMSAAMDQVLRDETFSGAPEDKETALSAYRKRLEDVKDAIPADQLLVFNVADGWAPLCAFLEVPQPDAPFPHENRKEEFWAAIGGEPADT